MSNPCKVARSNCAWSTASGLVKFFFTDVSAVCTSAGLNESTSSSRVGGPAGVGVGGGEAGRDEAVTAGEGVGDAGLGCAVTLPAQTAHAIKNPGNNPRTINLMQVRPGNSSEQCPCGSGSHRNGYRKRLCKLAPAPLPGLALKP